MIQEVIKLKTGYAPFTVYKVSWRVPKHGVESVNVKATNAEYAKDKVKRTTGMPKSQLIASVLVKKGQWRNIRELRVWK